MRAVLDPLGAVAGVRVALLSTPDGVPIAWAGRSTGEEEAVALAALVAGWVGEVARSVTPLSWSAPERLVLRASRGTIVVAQTARALLLVALEAGMSPEDVLLPMDAALARLQRNQRSSATPEARIARESNSDARPARASDVVPESSVLNPDQVPGIFPAHAPLPSNGAIPNPSLQSGVRPPSA